jgi:hypothetical protein
MFVSILIFGICYYVLQKKRISLKLVSILFSSLPFIIIIAIKMIKFSSYGPKESADVPPSVLNLLMRLPMAFTYGYSTLEYPERDIGWNISISEVLANNLVLVAICIFVFIALFIGFVHLLKKDARRAIFLAGAVFVPIIILITGQETGFSMLNEKHCAGVVGAWYILLAASMVEISRYLWGKCAIVLYIFLIGMSLYHFYFQSEIYSRRTNFTALNSFLTETINKKDLLIVYHFSNERNPDYLPILDKAENYIDLYQDKPQNTSFKNFISSISDDCFGNIYLIYDSRLRPGIDPDNSVLSFLMKQREFNLLHYGRNLKLYEFSNQKLISQKL